MKVLKRRFYKNINYYRGKKMKKGELELIDYAIYFATKAHTGQKRKSEKNVDMIFHPFTVGMILQRAGAKTECVIAGILHDVVEDTKYTLEDIKEQFGTQVANIVDEVSENKSLPWKERKIEAINKIKTASMDGKLVECADKISNLESLYNLYQEEGKEVWTSFNKPKEEQNLINSFALFLSSFCLSKNILARLFTFSSNSLNNAISLLGTRMKFTNGLIFGIRIADKSPTRLSFRL